MPKSALPPHLQESDWSGTDNASWLMRQKKKLQYLIAAGPRVPSGFFKWRELPVVLFMAKGKGSERWENSDGTHIVNDYNVWDFMDEYFYFSRIQCWLKWHVSLQWPLFLNFHVFYRKKHVVEYPHYKSDFGIHKLFTFQIGFKRDADRVYWLSAYIGGNFE